MAPEAVIRPILFPLNSANQIAPSGPAPRRAGPLSAVGIGNSTMSPPTEIRPILFPANSANQIAPSDPAAIPAGRLSGVGIRNSETVCAPAALASAIARHASGGRPSLPAFIG